MCEYRDAARHSSNKFDSALAFRYFCAMREHRMRLGIVQMNLTLPSPFAIFARFNDKT